MKKIFKFLTVIQICVACMLFAGITACSSDDEPTPTPPVNPKENGSVEFKVEAPTNGGSGTGTAADPVVVTKGEELNMGISQKSSYTDPDGSVFTCEPKATIKLSAVSDTIVAKDLTELTQVKNGSDVKNSTSGTSPVRNQTVQTFDIGGQKVVFDLSHEIYRHVNSLNERIEMPYIKVNPAKLGNAAATEETPTGRTAMAVRSVTVRPLVKSRAETITDSTMYEVTVRFNLDLESMNAKTDSKQTLEFVVTYVGVVETVTELKDPVRELSYQWQVSGTNSTSSPFVKQPRRTMELLMNQTSSFTDPYGNQYTGNPKAKVTVSALKDTIWVSSIDELTKFSDKTGNVSGVQTATQKFGNSLQEISLTWSYENSQELPYYALEPVSLKEVGTPKELGKKTVAGKKASLYEITATFSQKAVAQNFGDKTSEVEVEYVVSFVGAIEITLKEVRYEPFGEWIPSHDNLSLGYRASVRRIRVYSNGDELVDVFSDMSHPVTLFSEVEPAGTVERGNDGEFVITCYSATKSNVTDSTEVRTFKTEVPSWGTYIVGSSEVTFPTWDVASYGKSVDVVTPDSCPSGFKSNFPDDPNERASAWYYKGYNLYRSIDTKWNGYIVRRNAFRFMIHDQCLVIDGKCIDFKKLHGFDLSFDVDYKDFSEDWGHGQIVTQTNKMKYLGKTFVGTLIDSVYVATPKP